MAVSTKKYGIRIALCLLFFAQLMFFGYGRASDAVVAVSMRDTIGRDPLLIDSTLIDSLFVLDSSLFDSIILDSAFVDSLAVVDSSKKTSFLDDIVKGTTKDSLIYEVKRGKVRSFREADITYQNMNVKADRIDMDLNTKLMDAYGLPNDTTGVSSRPIFVEGGSEYTMDTVTYHIGTKKAIIKGALTKEGEGIMRGGLVKKMPDNTVNIAGGKYSTCDAECPHFYINMTKAKMTPGKKVGFGPAYFVMEDVPIYFLGLPFGFFPLNKERSSGVIMPTFGEQAMKGFFLREGGYYYAPNDYVDMTILGGIYTLGSWELSGSSRYTKRYKFNGNVNINYSQEVFGDKGSSDFGNMNNFRIQWTHSQDPKFRPGSTFAANVNFSTSGYNKYSSNNLNDYISAQTNSSVSYSKSWAGTPFSFSTNMNHSQNSRDTTVSLGFPNFTFNMSNIYPFRRKEAMGKQRWYEKISLSYNTNFRNSVTVKERDLFKERMFNDMKNGMNHSIKPSFTFSLFNYINITPNVGYTERWYFSRINKEWDQDRNRVVITDTTSGFYRVFDYNYSVNADTRLYGTYQFKGATAIRHVMSPRVGFSYTPDFGQSKFGYYKPIQTDSMGTIGYYSPYEGAIYGVPGRGKSASMNFGLSNTLQMKVRSKSDSTGTKKINILDALDFSGSYNFLADSMNLSLINVNLRSSIIKDFAINLNMVFDPYQVSEKGVRINKFLVEKGQLARLVSVSQSFSYSLSGGKTADPNAINSASNAFLPAVVDPYLDGQVDADGRPLSNLTRRNMMSSMYYDFSVPYNLSANYSISYRNNGIRKQISQTLGFNASVNLTPKWAVTYSGGYDFEAKQMTPGQFILTRDLHCWQMNFNWVPIGFMKSWSFNISVKSNMLKDLKYDKSSSFYDNFYDK